MNTAFREKLKDKQRIVIKIGSSSLTHPDTGYLDLIKLEVLVREISDLRNQGKDVILVSSGAIMVGSKTMGYDRKPSKMAQKQACAAIGQAKLMMIYQKLFAEYNQVASQILMTKHTILNNLNRLNAKNTFEELLRMGAIPIVNENDTISTYEIEFGDNDTLSAVVSAMVGADLLILLSDIDGLFTDDPHKNPEANFHRCGGRTGRASAVHGKGKYRKQRRNRWDGNQTDRSRDRECRRNRHDHRQRCRLSCHP